jgi:polysaccharide export outer membrane protein
MIGRLAWAALVTVAVLGTAAAQDAPQAAVDQYVLGAGDVLLVEAFDEEEISGRFTVEPTGAITFPLLGQVPVAGKTTAEVVALLERLLERDFYVDVQLKAEVSVFASQPVTLLGEIQSPGTYYLEGRTSLTELLAQAGGLKPTAGAVLELRRTAIQGDQGPPPPMTFSTARLMSGEVGREILVQAGDVIFVSPKKLFFMTGEVSRPGQYEISEGLTLMQAISQAGGVGKFASQSIEIHRMEGGERTIREFDDVVYVKRRFF